MSTTNENAKVGQIFNWYMDCAETGGHSTSGQPKTDSYLRNHRSLIDHHVNSEFRTRRFVDVTPVEFQEVIDLAASAGADSVARGLLEFFVDVDKFAVWKGVIEKGRARKLVAPTILRRPRVLTEKEFSEAWVTLRRCTEAGTLPSRLGSIAILLSGLTLQPLSDVLNLRRSHVDRKSLIWVERDQGRAHFVYLHPSAFALIDQAIAAVHVVYDDDGTDFIFPSVGPQGDAERPLGISSVHEACRIIFGSRKVKPQDFPYTALETLRGLGGQDLSDMLDRIVYGCGDLPNTYHRVVIDAWAGRLDDIERDAREMRWR